MDHHAVSVAKLAMGIGKNMNRHNHGGLAATLLDRHFFKFNLDQAIYDQAFARLKATPLRTLKKNIGPDLSGVYALYYKRRIVYIGKASKDNTKSRRTLKTRLNEHCAKLSTRRNITAKEVKVRFLTFESEWYVFAAEYALIFNLKPKWNASGFGSKIPGSGRLGTGRVSPWDSQFPRM